MYRNILGIGDAHAHYRQHKKYDILIRIPYSYFIVHNKYIGDILKGPAVHLVDACLLFDCAIFLLLR